MGSASVTGVVRWRGYGVKDSTFGRSNVLAVRNVSHLAWAYLPASGSGWIGFVGVLVAVVWVGVNGGIGCAFDVFFSLP